MVSLSQKIQFLYPASRPLTQWIVKSIDGVEVIDLWDAALGAQPTQAQLDSVTQADIDAAAASALHAAATAAVDVQDASGDRYRALVLVVLDAFNRQSKQYRDLLLAISQATSLANLQTRAAGISPVEPARTAQDLKDAIKLKISSGAAD